MSDARDETIALRNVEPGDGCWHSCSGCHETNEGAETGWYPYSKTFGCHLGAGCNECGGLGAVWDCTDYSDMGAFLAEQDAEKDRIAALEEQVARLTNDCGILLANIDYLEEAHGEGPDGGDRALVEQIRRDLQLPDMSGSRPSPAPSEAVREPVKEVAEAVRLLLDYPASTEHVTEKLAEAIHESHQLMGRGYGAMASAALRALASEGERDG